LIRQQDTGFQTGFDITGTGRVTELRIEPVSIGSAVYRIVETGTACAAFVSPEGVGSATASLPVARELSQLGLRAVLVDLTVAGAVSRSMLGTVSLPGITDLLAGTGEAGHVIHADRCGDCRIVPVGTVDPALAMRSAARLPEILQSLASIWDVIVVECGPASPGSLRWLGSGDIDMFISVAAGWSAADEKTISGIRDRFPDAIPVMNPHRKED